MKGGEAGPKKQLPALTKWSLDFRLAIPQYEVRDGRDDQIRVILHAFLPQEIHIQMFEMKSNLILL